jgi:ABC transporter substrate binding protein
MKRREFLTLIGGAVAFRPLAGHAQPAESARRIGMLIGTFAKADREGRDRIAAFLDTFQKLGWSDGRNFRMDYAVYPFPYFAMEGGMMSYGPNQIDQWRGAATYVDRILRGGKPSDLPVQQPTKFELVINLRTAKALGLNIPPAFPLRADQIIE